MTALPGQVAGGNGARGCVSGQPAFRRRMAGFAHLDHGSRERAQALVAAALSGGGEGGGATAGRAATPTVLSARRRGSLWAGYGSITECETDDEEMQRLIIKVSKAPSRALPARRQAMPPQPRPPPLTGLLPPPAGGQEVHPPALKGASHERKLRSYQVEAAFYERVAPRLPAGCHVPRVLGVHSTLHRSADGVGSGGGAPDGDSGCGTLQLVMADLRGHFPHS